MTWNYQKPVTAPLTRKQRDWAIGYLAHGNASLAARQAGYSHIQRGWDNVKKGVAEVFLEELGETSGALNAISPDALFAKLMKAIEDADQEGTRMRGLELAMRAKGMFTDKVQIEHTKTEDLLDKLRARSPEWAELVEKQLGVTEH